MINIMLADDHTIVREGIRLLLESDSELNISAEAMSGLQVIKHLEQGVKADVLITDLDMPDMDGVALMQEIQKRYAHIKVIILSMKTHDEDIMNAFNSGAQGYLVKSASSEEIIYAIKHVQKGKRYICADLSQHYFEKSLTKSAPALPDDPMVEFSSREKEILSLVAEGLTNSEMSEKLFLSKRTVEGQRQALIEKTGTKNTASLIKYAYLNRII